MTNVEMALERILLNVMASAHPHPTDHPAMFQAWSDARAELAGIAALRARDTGTDWKPTYSREGAHATFNGGHHNECCRAAFHHGMDTVFNIFDAGQIVLVPAPPPPAPAMPRYACRQCGNSFDHDPLTLTRNGIPAVTSYFCSPSCRLTWDRGECVEIANLRQRTPAQDGPR